MGSPEYFQKFLFINIKLKSEIHNSSRQATQTSVTQVVTRTFQDMKLVIMFVSLNNCVWHQANP